MASTLAIAGLVVASFVLFVLSVWFWGWLWRFLHRRHPKTVILEGENHLGGGFYNYCGAGTQYEKRKQGNVEPVNKLDECCQKHDETYNNADASWEEIRKSDEELVRCARTVPLQRGDELIDARIVAEGISGKIALEKAHLLRKGSFSRRKK